MDNNIEQRLTNQEEKIEAILTSVKKTERYFKITFWVTIIMFVLPLLGLVLIVPMFVSSYLSAFEGLI
jgi:hypothetical protein